jgi:8-oxo-dGTP diphosphatase
LGEELSHALKREIKEECGLVVEPGPLLAVTSRIIHDTEKRVQYHYVLLDYLCHWVGGRLRASSDARDARWLRVDEAEQMDLTEGLLDVVRRGESRRDSAGSKPGRRP